MRAGIEALNDGSVVLPATEEVRQPFDVRQNMSDSVLEARITEIVQRQTEPLFAEKFSALEERLEKLSAARDGGDDESLRQQLKQTQEQLEEVTRDRQQLQTELAELQKRLDAAEQNPDSAIDLSGKAGELVNFFRTLLPKDTKLPKNTMSKLREILEATED
jgi:DNA repair exonuclease SbcCD ATPase subunit